MESGSTTNAVRSAVLLKLCYFKLTVEYCCKTTLSIEMLRSESSTLRKIEKIRTLWWNLNQKCYVNKLETYRFSDSK